MRVSFVRGLGCLCLVAVVLAGLTAQAATISLWGFNEKAPGNPADIDPITGAIIDSVGGHNGDAYGGDEFGTGTVMPRYVAGATPWPSNSAMRFTLQDWPDQSSVCGDGEDLVYVPDTPDLNFSLAGANAFTIEAIVKIPDPMDIMDSGLYHGTREGYDEFPQWYDYTDNDIISKRASTGPGWCFRLTGGKLNLYLQGTSDFTYPDPHGGITVTGGLWHHVAAVVQSYGDSNSNSVTFYVDGALDRTVLLKDTSYNHTGIGESLANTAAASLANFAAQDRWSDQFIGDIDAIRVSSGALTPAQFLAFTPTPQNQVPTMNFAHVGTTDPNTEAHFKLVDKCWLGSGDDGQTSTWTNATQPPTSYTLASGRLHEVANSYAYYRALLAPEQLKDPTGWTLTGKMKLGASKKPWNECLAVEDGRDSWVMSFMDSTYVDAGHDPGAAGAGVYKSGAYDFTGGTGVAHFTNVVKMGGIDPTAMFHTYQLIYDPTGDGGNGIVKFYVDGALLDTQTRAEARDATSGNNSDSRFWFGDSYPLIDNRDYYWGDTGSDAYWGDVKMQTGAHLAVAWDPNFDGVCGAGDLDIVRANWGQSKTPNDWAHGELTGDGVVGAADLDLVRSHWGQSVPAPGIGPVPEPSTFVLLAMGGLMLLLRRRAH